jgi:hypothetical protein
MTIKEQNITNTQIRITATDSESRGEYSDECHTFNELYDTRMALNAMLFNELSKNYKYGIHKSLRHNDGELCFGGKYFIVVATLPSGVISFHYGIEHWDLFNIPEVRKSHTVYDGYTTQDVIKRLLEACTELKVEGMYGKTQVV